MDKNNDFLKIVFAALLFAVLVFSLVLTYRFNTDFNVNSDPRSSADELKSKLQQFLGE